MFMVPGSRKLKILEGNYGRKGRPTPLDIIMILLQKAQGTQAELLATLTLANQTLVVRLLHSCIEHLKQAGMILHDDAG